MDNLLYIYDIDQLMVDKLMGEISEEEDDLLKKMIRQDKELEAIWQELLKLYLACRVRIYSLKYDPHICWHKLSGNGVYGKNE